MKHLPYACLLTLGASAAFASLPPSTVTASAPSSLFANNVELGYVQQSTSGVSGHLDGWRVSATTYIGKTDVFVNGLTTLGGDLGNGSDAVSLGYRFKNVASLVDVALTIGSDETYGIALHRALGGGFGAWASYVRNFAGHEVNATVSKMLTHDISLDLGYTWITLDGTNGQDQWSLGVRYKF
jgi:opacity protein-like surface antigen